MYPPQLTICFRLPAVRPILFKPVEMRLVDTWGRLEGLLEEQNFSAEELTESLGRLGLGGWGWWGWGWGGWGWGAGGDEYEAPYFWDVGFFWTWDEVELDDLGSVFWRWQSRKPLLRVLEIVEVAFTIILCLKRNPNGRLWQDSGPKLSWFHSHHQFWLIGSRTPILLAIHDDLMLIVNKHVCPCMYRVIHHIMSSTNMW